MKPTFDTLTEEGHKAFKAYRANLKELFLSHCEVMWQGTVLKDTMSIIIRKAEVTSEVQPNPSASLNDVKSMIDFASKRQAKSTDELLCRLIEDQDGKKTSNPSINPSSSSCTVTFAQTNPQTSGTSVGSTTRPNP
jgi:negative regulator of genetic competence, sporulation and motility